MQLKIATQGEALINLLQLFLFEDLSGVIGKLNFVQRYPSRMDIAGNMLRELANVNAVADFAGQRVLTLQYNCIAFSQLKHKCKTLVESRIIDLNRFHVSYHRWFSPFFKMCKCRSIELTVRSTRAVAYRLRFSCDKLMVSRVPRMIRQVMSLQRLRNVSFASDVTGTGRRHGGDHESHFAEQASATIENCRSRTRGSRFLIRFGPLP